VEKKLTAKKIPGIIGSVLFFASYSPYFVLVYTGIAGTQRGLFGGAYIYGFDAMWKMFVWNCIVPIFPLCILYQLVFGIFYIRKHKILTVITLITAAVTAASILSVGFTYENMKKRQINEDFDLIRSHLSEEYGNDLYSYYGIRVLDYEGKSYMLRSTVLPDGAEFAVYTDEDYTNDLISRFEICNENFHSEYEAYLESRFDLPENMHIQAEITAIDFGSYRDGDDYTMLFDRASYRISGIIVELEEADDSVITETLEKIWKEQSPKYENRMSNESVIMTRDSDLDVYQVYIKVKGQNAFSVTVVYRLYNNSNTAYANITVYSDYKDNTSLDNTQIKLVR
jgi:hypothetical protein